MKLRITVEGTAYEVLVDVLPDGPNSPVDAEPEWDGEFSRPPYPIDTVPDDQICRTPIAGAIVAVAVAPGQRVRKDDPIATIEAMKMQTKIGAPIAGIVESVSVKPGDAVKSGQVLCKLS